MKTLLLNFWTGFLLFISPLFPLMLIITLAVIFDTFVGRWYARTQGEVVTSGKTRKGLTVKLLIYLVAIFFSFLLDKFIINEITTNYVWFDFLFTKFWTSFFIWIEYTSIDEKFKWVTGEGITDRVCKYVKSLKKPLNSILDIKNKI